MEIDWDHIDYERLSELFNERLHEVGITKSDVSRELGVSRQFISLAFSGRRRISSGRLREIMSILEIEENEVPVKRTNKARIKAKGEKIFISYSHRDKPFLDRLMVHLKPLEKQGLIDPWADTRLLVGDSWKKEIEKALKGAKVGILLISADFLASDFIISNEMQPLLQSAKDEGTLILPVILKPCRFLRDKNLRKFHAVNAPEEPLSLLDENERELIYDTIAQRIEDEFDQDASYKM